MTVSALSAVSSTTAANDSASATPSPTSAERPPLPFILSSEFLDNPTMPILPPMVRQLLAARVDHNVVLRVISRVLAVDIRDSTIHGQGLFARDPIESGALICPIFGTFFRRSTLDPYRVPLGADDPLGLASNEIQLYGFTLDGHDLSIFMHSLCIARYANDGKRKSNAAIIWNPRYETTDHVVAYRIDNHGLLPYDLLCLAALQPIAADEEITFSYGASQRPRLKVPRQQQHSIMSPLDVLLPDDQIQELIHGGASTAGHVSSSAVSSLVPDLPLADDNTDFDSNVASISTSASAPSTTDLPSATASDAQSSAASVSSATFIPLVRTGYIIPGVSTSRRRLKRTRSTAPLPNLPPPHPSSSSPS
jgi:hypothetical protein